LNQSKDAYAQSLKDAISFPKTLPGNRQRLAWRRLITYIESSACTSAFDKAAAYAEGYAQALVDSEQIEISTGRDLLIIATVDAWRRNRIDPNTSAHL